MCLPFLFSNYVVWSCANVSQFRRDLHHTICSHYFNCLLFVVVLAADIAGRLAWSILGDVYVLNMYFFQHRLLLKIMQVEGHFATQSRLNYWKSLSSSLLNYKLR